MICSLTDIHTIYSLAHIPSPQLYHHMTAAAYITYIPHIAYQSVFLHHINGMSWEASVRGGEGREMREPRREEGT